MHNDAILSYSISSEEPPPDAQGQTEDRLGGPPSVPELAPAATRAQRAAMAKPHLNLEERIELEAALRAGDTQAKVAARLTRSAGTISREVALNGGPGNYRAAVAHRAAQGRRGAARRGDCAIDEHPPLRAEVHERLHRGWSPEEIAGSLKIDHPDLPLMHTSHESIYRYVYVVARGALQRELAACLRRHHRRRRPRRRGVAATQGKLQDMVLIDHRPPEVESRLLPGHYEGDLILGAGNKSAVGVLVERTSRFTFLCHLQEKNATSVREAFTRKLDGIPATLLKSLTYDQGKEMAQHKQLAADLNLQVFFCHPHSPWERGTCESQNGRIRHYLPKGSDLSKVSYQQLSAYQEMLNERPRKILGWKSPAQVFSELLISKLSSN